MIKTLSLLLAAALAAPASAQTFGMSEELGAAVMGARALGAGAARQIQNFRAAAAAADPAAKAFPAINTGFSALGAAGKTGSIQGPAGTGGTYRVIQNDAAQMVFDMNTPFVVGRFTMKRDQTTGKDILGFEGQTKDGIFGGWTPSKGTYAGTISYAPGSDSGVIDWQMNGERIRDTYKGGRAGSRSMTITLKGNEHTFTQN